MTDLTSFEGKQVATVGIEIPGAGGGLHDALEVDPVEFHLGDECSVLLHCRTVKVRFDPIKDEDTLNRVHVMRVVNATIVDPESVRGHLERQRKRIEEAKGIQELPLGDPVPVVMEGTAAIVAGFGPSDEEATGVRFDPSTLPEDSGERLAGFPA
jgi:hypothetical protein